MDTPANRRRFSRVLTAAMAAQTLIAFAAALAAILLPLTPARSTVSFVLLIAAAAVLICFLVIGRASARATGSQPAAPPPPANAAGAAEQSDQHRGYFDDLTGLPARPWYTHLIASEIARSARYHHALSQVILYIDDFSRLNQHQGRAGGDYVLMAVADILRTGVRVSDQISRIADDEFAVVVPETDLGGAEKVGEKIRRAIELFPFDEGLEITVSVGVCALSASDTRESFLQRAEEAARSAREKGGNVCVVSKT